MNGPGSLRVYVTGKKSLVRDHILRMGLANLGNPAVVLNVEIS